MSSRLTAIAVVTVAVLALATIAITAGNPFVGTWKLNVEKSKSGTGALQTGSHIEKISVKDNILTNEKEAVAADGKASHALITLILDGKERPLRITPIRLTRK